VSDLAKSITALCAAIVAVIGLIQFLNAPPAGSSRTSPTPGGQAIISQWTEDFETPDKGWFFTSGAGFDLGKGFAHTGDGNGWVASTKDWNAINIFRDVQSDRTYTVQAWLNLSPKLTDGYFSVRAAPERNLDGPILREIKLVGPSPSDRYKLYSFTFNTTGWRMVLIYVGLWGNGQDSWIRIDDVVLTT